MLLSFLLHCTVLVHIMALYIYMCISTPLNNVISVGITIYCTCTFMWNDFLKSIIIDFVLEKFL